MMNVEDMTHEEIASRASRDAIWLALEDVRGAITLARLAARLARAVEEGRDSAALAEAVERQRGLALARARN